MICLPHRPKISDFFDLCLNWVSLVHDSNYRCFLKQYLLNNQTKFSTFKLRHNQISWWDAKDINATIICHNDELSSSLAWLEIVYNSIFWESATRLIHKSWESLNLFVNNQTQTQLINNPWLFLFSFWIRIVQQPLEWL